MPTIKGYPSATGGFTQGFREAIGPAMYRRWQKEQAEAAEGRYKEQFGWQKEQTELRNKMAAEAAEQAAGERELERQHRANLERLNLLSAARPVIKEESGKLTAQYGRQNKEMRVMDAAAKRSYVQGEIESRLRSGGYGWLGEVPGASEQLFQEMLTDKDFARWVGAEPVQPVAEIEAEASTRYYAETAGGMGGREKTRAEILRMRAAGELPRAPVPGEVPTVLGERVPPSELGPSFRRPDAREAEVPAMPARAAEQYYMQEVQAPPTYVEPRETAAPPPVAWASAPREGLARRFAGAARGAVARGGVVAGFVPAKQQREIGNILKKFEDNPESELRGEILDWRVYDRLNWLAQANLGVDASQVDLDTYLREALAREDEAVIKLLGRALYEAESEAQGGR